MSNPKTKRAPKTRIILREENQPDAHLIVQAALHLLGWQPEVSLSDEEEFEGASAPTNVRAA